VSAVPAFRFRDGHVFALAAGSRIHSSSHALVAEDAGSGLAVLSRTPLPPAPFIPGWAAERTVEPRYLLAAVAAASSGPALQPVFVGALQPIDSAIWSASVWTLETATAAVPGMLLFTTGGAFAGIVAEENGGTILVPAPVVTAAAERLLDTEPRAPGTLGFEVQTLPQAFAASTGMHGLVVAWVDPEGPAAGLVAATDIIEGIETAATLSMETWRVRRSRIAAGDEISLRIRRDGVVHAVTVVAAEVVSPTPAPATLGLTLRFRPRAGSEVVSVERGSAADRAGLRPGDVMTRVGSVSAPTPAAVTAAFSALEDGQALLAAVTRGDEHLVLELVKP
jgi:serine protease Do